MLSQETMELVDPFSKPVPGQSLTNDPDNPYPWESPPEFVNVNAEMHVNMQRCRCTCTCS